MYQLEESCLTSPLEEQDGLVVNTIDFGSEGPKFDPGQQSCATVMAVVYTLTHTLMKFIFTIWMRH